MHVETDERGQQSPTAGRTRRCYRAGGRRRGAGSSLIIAGAFTLCGAGQVGAYAPPVNDVPIVRLHTHAREKPVSAAARRDAAQARQEMGPHLQQIEAAAALLEHGFKTKNLAEIRNVFDTMQQLDVRLAGRAPGLNGDRWPEADDTAFGDCSDAADRLSALAAEPTGPATVRVVAERQNLINDFKRKHAACAAWVSPRHARSVQPVARRS